MSGLPTGHVGDLAAALVDDQLDPSMRELVLRHMIGCLMCRDEVEEQRQLKARLSSLAEPGLPLGLFGRLSALKDPVVSSGPLAADSQAGAGIALMSQATRTPVEPLLPVAEAESDQLGPHGRVSVRSPFFADAHRGRRLLAGAASLLIVGVGAAYAAASDGQIATPTQPTANVFTSSEANEATASVPLNDPTFTAMTASFGH